MFFNNCFGVNLLAREPINSYRASKNSMDSTVYSKYLMSIIKKKNFIPDDWYTAHPSTPPKEINENSRVDMLEMCFVYLQVF